MQLMGLIFTTAACLEQTNAFCDSIPGTFCRFAAPLGVSYMLTDADYIHIASQYRCVPADVPVSVCLLYCYDPGPLLERRVQDFWDNSILPHHVKGITLTSEMQPHMDEFVNFLLLHDLLPDVVHQRAALGLNATAVQPTPPRSRGLTATMERDRQRRRQRQFEAARRDMHQQELERIGAISLTARVQQALDIAETRRENDARRSDERVAAEAAQRDRDIQEALPSIESLFHPQNPTSTQPTPERTQNVDHRSVTNYYRNRAAATGTYSQRQAESAARRREARQAAEQPAWVIDWNKIDVWICPGPEGTAVHWPISQMVDQHLWTTINWLVITCPNLYRQYNRVDSNESTAIGLLAKRWLATRPVFRALLQEALRRRLTFPQEVFQYLKEYVLGRDSQAVQVSQPWADPAAAYQNQELAGFLDEPIVLPKEIDSIAEFGRDFRIIDL